MALALGDREVRVMAGADIGAFYVPQTHESRSLLQRDSDCQRSMAPDGRVGSAAELAEHLSEQGLIGVTAAELHPDLAHRDTNLRADLQQP